MLCQKLNWVIEVENFEKNDESDFFVLLNQLHEKLTDCTTKME